MSLTRNLERNKVKKDWKKNNKKIKDKKISFTEYWRKFQNAKGITLVALVITIITLLILAGTTIAIIMPEITNENANVNTESTVKQEHCQHEYVITSKWDFFRESYKTISKCSKCGKEVE